MLVEDDLSLIEGLRYFLGKQGYEVSVVRTVKEAEERFANVIFNMVLLDVMLPDGSGFEFAVKSANIGSPGHILDGLR
ncbi:hypothetical protein HMSSN036_63940 [Paenibacillus macerans]|nr:hypothetical protein HMSSN036_63940 [Paenibacillus macerans]